MIRHDDETIGFDDWSNGPKNVQAAQELTLRTIRDEKARTSDLLKETQKRFEEREKEAAVKFEQAEENWRAEK